MGRLTVLNIKTKNVACAANKQRKNVVTPVNSFVVIRFVITVRDGKIWINPLEIGVL